MNVRLHGASVNVTRQAASLECYELHITDETSTNVLRGTPFPAELSLMMKHFTDSLHQGRSVDLFLFARVTM